MKHSGTVLLAKAHRKQEFRCGEPSLDRYLHNQASQDIKRQLSTCFVLVKDEIVKGCYTLSGGSIPKDQVPEDMRRRIPYQDVPVTLLGRLAINEQHQGQGLGELLLLDALKRSYDVSMESVGSLAVVVDPLHEKARRFYSKYGFLSLDSGRMFLPMKAIRQLFH